MLLVVEAGDKPMIVSTISQQLLICQTIFRLISILSWCENMNRSTESAVIVYI